MIPIQYFTHHAFFSLPEFEEVWHPATDVYLTPDKLMVKIELPGCSLEDISVAVQARSLTVKGIKKNCCESGIMAYQQLEISYGYFQRSIQLPTGVNTENAHARFENGVLTIEFEIGENEPEEQIIIRIG